MAICIFEDPAVSNLLPLVHCQPTFDLRCGIYTLRERIARFFPHDKIALLVRPQLADIMIERVPHAQVNSRLDGRTVFINARLLLDNYLAKCLRDYNIQNVILSIDNEIAAVTTLRETSAAIWHALATSTPIVPPEEFMRISVVGKMIHFPWDLITHNGKMIRSDARTFTLPIHERIFKSFPHVVFLKKENIFIGESCTIQPGVVINAEEGPVVIGDHVTIMANAVIVGPAYIGENTIVKIGAKIYENTSIGPVCKVGGEIEDSIVHSYANKQHDGFLGHSYLAPWTNIGADTNTSDVKNTYGEIRMTLEGVEYDTYRQFLGLIMADHSKCGINTMFNTGTSVGVGCNIFGGGYPPKYIPSFSWGGSDGIKLYEFEKFIQVARVVMQRRGVQLSSAEERLLHHIYNEQQIIQV